MGCGTLMNYGDMGEEISRIFRKRELSGNTGVCGILGMEVMKGVKRALVTSSGS
jgi:hypothetical protein